MNEIARGDTTTKPGNRLVRASDRDREEIVQLLGEHAAAGRLSMVEFEERVAAVYAVTVLADLDRLLVDLPVVRSDRRTGRPAGRSRAARARSGLAHGHVQLRTWLFVSVLCTVIWAATSLASTTVLYFWPVWVVGPWGAVIFSRMFGGGCARPRSAGSRAGR